MLKELLRKRVYSAFIKLRNFDDQLLCEDNFTEESSAPVMKLELSQQFLTNDDLDLRASKDNLMNHFNNFMHE